MFNSEEIKSLRQEIEALTAQIDQLEATLDSRLTEIGEKLDAFEVVLKEERETEKEVVEENDELELETAREIVIDIGRASTSLLQRAMGIGYAKAARLIDALEAEGVIAPGDGAKPREVLAKEETT